MRILLTGSAGFVGRHFQAAVPDDHVVGVDLVDGIDCLDFFRHGSEHRGLFDLAVHCAATIGGRAGIDGSPLAVATNLALDSLFFRWLTVARVPRAVYFSSSAAYPVALQTGTPPWQLRETDIDLDLPGVPDATYGLAKLTGERLAREAEAAGVQIIIPRPFSGYGEDQALDYPFPSFIDRAARREDPFTIWGDGEQTRDLIHISDVIAATLTALDEGVDGPFNVGTGRATSFNELARLVCNTAGYTPTFEHLPAAPTGVRHRVADMNRLTEFYLPIVPLEVGVDRAFTVATTGRVVA